MVGGDVTPLWGGRFSKPPAEEAHALGFSLDFDIELLQHDVAASKAHVHGLGAAGVLSDEDVKSLAAALDGVEAYIDEHAEELDQLFVDVEDVHSLVERVVTLQLGDVGGKLHAGRSRNDLVVTDLRLWTLSAASEIDELVRDLLDTIVVRAREGSAWPMPGLTHNRPAQVVTLGFQLMGHAFGLTRDLERIDDWAIRADRSPLGAGAIATSTLDLDPMATAHQMGFSAAFENALDAVADRDFALEFLSWASILSVHLSRLAADLARWSEPWIGYVELDDAYSTGSSMMPQKRNPDVLELTRGKAARVAGDLVGLTALVSGLPLGYHRDLQEDKEPLFDAVSTLLLVVPALNGALKTATFAPDRMRADSLAEDLYATDLAEALVKDGVPFREAHRRTGALLKELALTSRGLRDLTPEEWAEFGVADGASMMDPEVSVAARTMPGGTATERVLEQCEEIAEIVAEGRT